MISTLTALILILVAVTGSAAMVGILGYLLHRLRRIEAAVAEGRQIDDARQVELLRSEVAELQGEIAALADRLDFTEKLLSPGDGGTEEPGS